MQVVQLGLPEVLEIIPDKFVDPRGFFSETYNANQLRTHGIDLTFVQDNHSFSSPEGVLRGLHYQEPPYAQDKLVRVTRGSIFDVAVDIRRGSPRFGKWCSLVVSAELWNQILVPKGFAHGFLTLEPNTEVIYKVSNEYAPSHERSIHFSDPEIGIAWPIKELDLLLSEKDRTAPMLQELPNAFEYTERSA